jgi:hypothetical protein
MHLAETNRHGQIQIPPHQQLPEIPLTGPDHSQVLPSCVDVFCNILVSCHVLMLFEYPTPMSSFAPELLSMF